MGICTVVHTMNYSTNFSACGYEICVTKCPVTYWKGFHADFTRDPASGRQGTDQHHWLGLLCVHNSGHLMYIKSKSTAERHCLRFLLQIHDGFFSTELSVIRIKPNWWHRNILIDYMIQWILLFCLFNIEVLVFCRAITWFVYSLRGNPIKQFSMHYTSALYRSTA